MRELYRITLSLESVNSESYLTLSNHSKSFIKEIASDNDANKLMDNYNKILSDFLNSIEMI